MPNSHFRATPRPDSEVVQLLEQLLEGARLGRVRSVAVVMVNPLNSTEVATAGDLGPIRANALIGGLTRTVNSLTAKF